MEVTYIMQIYGSLTSSDVWLNILGRWLFQPFVLHKPSMRGQLGNRFLRNDTCHAISGIGRNRPEIFVATRGQIFDHPNLDWSDLPPSLHRNCQKGEPCFGWILCSKWWAECNSFCFLLLCNQCLVSLCIYIAFTIHHQPILHQPC